MPILQTCTDVVVPITEDRGRNLDDIANHTLGRISPTIHLGLDRFDHDAPAPFSWFHRCGLRPKFISTAVEVYPLRGAGSGLFASNKKMDTASQHPD
jgi:hypothetical protein